MTSDDNNSAVVYGSETSKKDDAEKVHAVVGIIFIILLFGLLGVVYVTEQSLPTALYINNEETYPNSFITERAKMSLKALTDLGPRITGGHANEVLAVNLLKKEITEIIKSANRRKIIDLDVQLATGAFGWFGIGNSFINAYANIQNVVVKLYGKNATHSILINAHFDSKPLGPGGSDDGINCANMLEILRKLATSQEEFEHNVIFLFNGSEEPALQGSHAFITQHKWAGEIKVVVNLDAAGAGGKIAIFNTGPKQPWLMKYYSKVPYPKGQVFSEEGFQSGIVPSDTDFSIFSRIGGLVGMDFCYHKDGYRYHTSYDGFENIPDGTYQHGGENTLKFVQSLANAPEIALNFSELTSDNLVFYDYLGLFMIYYNETTGIIINVFTVLLFLAVAAKSIYDLKLELSKQSLIYLVATTVILFLGWILAAGFVIIIASLLDLSKQSMSWFSNTWLILGLYMIPVFTITCASVLVINYVTKMENLSISATALIRTHLVTLIWTIILLLGTILRIRSICFIQVLVFFQTISYILIIVARLQNAARKWQVVYVVCSIFPNIILMMLGLFSLGFISPVTGRMGASTNSELLISVSAVLFTLLVTSGYTPLISFIRKPEIILGVLASVFVLFFIIALTPLGFPYRSSSAKSPTPQRYWMHHTSRTFRNENNEIYKSDGGFYLSNMDRNAPSYVEKYVSDFVNVSSITEDCENSIFCGLPYSKFRSFGITWIPAEKPIIDKPINLTLESKTAVTSLVTRLSFIASGVDYMEVYVSPKPNATLVNINLIKEKPDKIQNWNGRPVYVIQYICGKTAAPLKFSIDIESAVANSKEPLIDIALVGRYVHIDTTIRTEHYNDFILQFPSWTDVVPWLAVYESWIY